MNYEKIEQLTGQDTAARLRDAEHIDRQLSQNALQIDPQALDELTRGGVILGVEPVDYPLTDGLEIYIKQPAGGVMVLAIDAQQEEDSAGGYLPAVLQVSGADI